MTIKPLTKQQVDDLVADGVFGSNYYETVLRIEEELGVVQSKQPELLQINITASDLNIHEIVADFIRQHFSNELGKDKVFHYKNVANRCMVIDVDELQELPEVDQINITTGEITIAVMPLRIDGDKFATKKIKFRSIYPIYGESPLPVMFHCYGRIAE